MIVAVAGIVVLVVVVVVVVVLKGKNSADGAGARDVDTGNVDIGRRIEHFTGSAPEPEAEPEPEPEPVVEPERVAVIEPEAVAVIEPEPVGVTDPEEDEDEFDRFASPGARARGVPQGMSAELPPVIADPQQPGAVLPVEPEPEPVAVVEPEPEPEPVPEPELPQVATLVPEPVIDPVDHILRALVDRARERKVGIAEVAAELVEQAELEDRDIDDVLADLVGRVEGGDDTRVEELTLFGDAVPNRPGQLTDFGRLDTTSKKKVIIRVLCLLVAMREERDSLDEEQAPVDEPAGDQPATPAWPTARAAWPGVATDDADLPNRRLVRGGR